MEEKDLFVDLILPVPIRQLFTYKVPYNLIEKCEIGKRAIVQFGKKKVYSSIIQNIHNTEPQNFEIKEISDIIDDAPIVNKNQFHFWEWMANYYMCSQGDVYKAALPAGLRLESNTSITYNEEFFENEANSNFLNFNAKETSILDALNHKRYLNINEINDLLKVKSSLTHIKSLYDKGAIIVQENLDRGFQAKTQKYLTLNPEIANDDSLNNIYDQLKRAKKQQEILGQLLELINYEEGSPLKEISQKQFMNDTGATSAAISQLVKKDIIQVIQKDISRLDFSTYENIHLNALNEVQQIAFAEIKSLFEEKTTVLLHGVTSSGKTEIYIHLIAEFLKKGQQVLYLLPEIALTSQIVERLKKAFGNKVGVYHSKYSDSERVETYKNVLGDVINEDNRYQIILGVRSSIFLPFNNLGLIIVDEEHENTFKQFNPAPRYQARDAAVFLAHLHKSKVLLGSATPSIESYYNAKAGKYGLVTITQRHQNIAMPEIKIANIRDAKRKKQMKSHFTPLLLSHIENALNNNEQVILFQNRRGFAPYIECHSCGWIPKCEHCDVSLTYHQHTNQLVCHYCGFSYTGPNNCPDCKDADIRTRGFGTEKIEEELKLMFPERVTKRMDLDTSKGKKAHARLIADFENQNIDILVGTQMISKGLDFANVSLVGILDANQMLHFPDFRAYERSYQLMAQVSGRAGRKNKQGQVVIQTMSPENPIVQLVRMNDYEGMFKIQTFERQNFRYPPYNRLINITLKHKDKKLLDYATEHYANWLKKAMKENVIGPEYPIVSKIYKLYLKSILIKIEKSTMAEAYKKYILEASDHLLKQEGFKSIQIVFDVDPY